MNKPFKALIYLLPVSIFLICVGQYITNDVDKGVGFIFGAFFLFATFKAIVNIPDKTALEIELNDVKKQAAYYKAIVEYGELNGMNIRKKIYSDVDVAENIKEYDMQKMIGKIKNQNPPTEEEMTEVFSRPRYETDK